MLKVLVEGYRDEIFVTTVLGKVISTEMSITQYSKLKKDKLQKLINSLIKAAENGHIQTIILFDSDFNNLGKATTYTQETIDHKISTFCAEYAISKKQKILNTILQIVVIEIEGWYVAGMTQQKCKRYKIDMRINANTLTKEQFEQKIDQQVTTPVLRDILDGYSIKQAQTRNNSFKQFIDKLTELNILTI